MLYEVITGERGLRRDESSFTPHEFDQADAHIHARGLDMRALDCLGRLLHGRIEPEGSGDEVDVVINGLSYNFV